MDEQRLQAHVGLIEQLLRCPQGQEGELLQANAELVDAGLLEVMEQVATHLESHNGSNARWLRRFAAHLGEALRLGTATAETEEAKQFLLETLQLVADSQGNPQQVYPVWIQQQERLNSALLEVLPQVVTRLFAEEKRTFVATVLFTFGNLIQQFPLGTRWLNLELGIAAYHQSLEIRTRDAFPEQWAAIQNNLAIAYSDRIQGDRAQNLDNAIAAFQRVLEIRTRDAFPEQWAAAQSNLATAYSDRIRGDRAQDLDNAIAAFQRALGIYTYETFPEQWAATQNNLAIAYKNRIRGDRAQNLDDAIAAAQRALEIYTSEAFPEDWAMTQNNLANAYKNRIRGDRAQNLDDAITAYQRALAVYTRDAFPEQWAMTQNNLAIAYTDRIRGDRAQNLDDAIAAYQQILEIRTREAFPEQWAATQNNLATAYKNRIRGDRAQNLDDAIAAYQWALEIRTRDAFPEQWAGTQSNLATTYSIRVRGDRAQNLDDAIAAYQQILEIRTRETFPEDWAMTQSNLATTYSIRVRGDRDQNLDTAINAYKRALEIYTYETFPAECRITSHSLANIQAKQQNWNAATEAYTQALAAAEILYQACILLDSRAAELSVNASLPLCAAYAYAKVGDLQRAVLTIETNRARGLSESLARDRSNLSQLQQTHPFLFTQYQDITAQLRNLETQQRLWLTSEERQNLTPDAFRADAIRLHQTLMKIIEQIRQVNGYKDFLKLSSFNEIQQAARPGIPLVYLVPTSAGSIVLIVTQDGITDLWLNGLTDSNLIDLLKNTWFHGDDQSQTNHQVRFNKIDQVAHQLWQLLMAPLIDQLKQHHFQQATLISTGFLSSLPLHVAWTEDSNALTGRHYALDDIHFTYVPNAKSLSAAQNIADFTPADSILAIDNPTQDKKLANSEREINAAIASFSQHIVLRHAEAKIENVRAKFPEAAIVHFSCHGTANLNEPLNSGLVMSDGLLTLKDIFALNLAENGGLRLAILSACETGIQGLDNADEAVSLPTGLLQAGVAAVIASLWSVDDRSTRILLTRFYDLWRKEHLEPSVALRQAQLWVRDISSQQKAKYFQETNPDLFQSLILLPPDYFAHPFHWAAFSYTGV